MNGEITGLILFFIGIYGMTSHRNIIKSIICLNIMDVGVILFFLALNDSYIKEVAIGKNLGPNTVDPLPQALMITAIVIGVSVSALSLTMFVNLYHKYGTTNWKIIMKERNRRRE